MTLQLSRAILHHELCNNICGDEDESTDLFHLINVLYNIEINYLDAGIIIQFSIQNNF